MSVALTSVQASRESFFRVFFMCVCARMRVCRVDVVICLSTMVRNDTLQEVKDQRVSMKCRRQLRVEELEMVNL